MRSRRRAFGWAVALLLVAAEPRVAPAQEGRAFTRQADVIYGRKYGTALTMDVFMPKKANGAAAILVVSGGWSSAHEFPADSAFAGELLKRGYTVFAVFHSSQPQYTIPESIRDVNRAVRFIRHHARDYNLDRSRFGIYGASSGGHLALMQALAGDAGDPSAKDPVEKESSRVQAVACFFPPTDFLNYGKPGEVALGRGALAGLKAAFAFREFDTTTKTFVPVKDEDQIRPPLTRRRARLASWRAEASDRPTTGAISSNGRSNKSCSTKASCSAGVKVLKTIRMAEPMESASSASSAGLA